MANFYGYTRTNYFKVTDPARLIWLIDRAGGELWTKEQDGETYYGFGSEEHELDFFYDENDIEYELDEEIQKILPPGEVHIRMEVGHERLRYLAAYSTIITSSEIKIVNLFNNTIHRARKMNPHISNMNVKLDY